MKKVFTYFTCGFALIGFLSFLLCISFLFSTDLFKRRIYEFTSSKMSSIVGNIGVLSVDEKSGKMTIFPENQTRKQMYIFTPEGLVISEVETSEIIKVSDPVKRDIRFLLFGEKDK